MAARISDHPRHLGLKLWEYNLYLENQKEFFEYLKEIRIVRLIDVINTWRSYKKYPADEDYYQPRLEKLARAWIRKINI